MSRSRLAALLALAVALAGLGGGWLLLQERPLAAPVSAPRPADPLPAPSPSSTPAPTSPPAPPGAPARNAVVYLHYYLWWTPQHWREKLGPGYPYGAASPPQPGETDATGCQPRASYPGAQVVDLPRQGLYDQRQVATVDSHLLEAAAAGVSGFLVGWQGIGEPGQTPGSSGYDSRLDLLASRVDAFDRDRPGAFGLGLAFASFGDYNRPASRLIADLDYFAARYGADAAFRNPYSERPLVMWLDSRKYPLATVRAVSAAVRGRLYLVGDETPRSWARDAAYLDATSYYWSSENPWQNGQAGASLAGLASAVRAQRKRWFAPFIPGYDKQLEGGTCVPRRGTDTLRTVWAVNAASHPAGWFGISWNELVEGTYLEPTQAYGSAELDTLRGLIEG